jgi:hypothetical protein
MSNILSLSDDRFPSMALSYPFQRHESNRNNDYQTTHLLIHDPINMSLHRAVARMKILLSVDSVHFPAFQRSLRKHRWIIPITHETKQARGSTKISAATGLLAKGWHPQ